MFRTHRIPIWASEVSMHEKKVYFNENVVVSANKKELLTGLGRKKSIFCE